MDDSTSTKTLDPDHRVRSASARGGSARYEVRVIHGPDQGRAVPLSGRMLVGTHPDTHLRLSDPTVSRLHLELDLVPEGVRVRDLDSHNGTFMGGAKVGELVGRQLSLVLGKTHLQVVEVSEGTPRVASDSFAGFRSQSPRMRGVFGTLERVAPSDVSVLITGETGVGKSELARAIHARSPRAGGPLVVVDCGALSPGVIESELFGHVRGAFSGATADRAGAFVEADGGTLVLDGVSELPLEHQPKLLRALDARAVVPVGSTKERAVNVRVLAITCRDLADDVLSGRFRQDLFYRLAVVELRIPPLRERFEDVPGLVEHFLAELGQPSFTLSPALRSRMQEHPWPGNVRELRNLVERVSAGVDAEDALRHARELAGKGEDPLLTQPFMAAKDALVQRFAHEYLTRLVDRFEGNISDAAKAAGLARPHLYELLRRHGVKRGE